MKRTYERITPNGPEVYRFPALDELGFITFFSGRGGGVSGAPYDSLNVSVSVGDDPANVKENLNRITRAAGCGAVWKGNQVHGDAVAVIESSPPPEPVTADAVVVTIPGVAVGVVTADCLPILLADPGRNIAAAVHAGRRSAEFGLAYKTAGVMAERFGADPEAMRAAFGPCIRPCCYEVDEGTAEDFYERCGGSMTRCLDLADANIRQLEDAGLSRENIVDCGLCTACEHHRFFSYRKDGKTTGRFVTGIAIPKS